MATANPCKDGEKFYDNQRMGCQHYKRKAKFISPCCYKIYPCRWCHDENENHSLNRKEVVEIVCAICETRQYVQTYCKSCGVRFGRYTCLACKLFDDEDRNQFHCTECTICRIGGSMNYFHCNTCGICLPNSVKNSHKCIENSGHSDCAVCLEDIHSSRVPSYIPPCGHLLHTKCYESLTESGRKDCPICQKPMK